ncbi:MAG TPA: MMPL family transporter [Candidatus Limnocylindrales bacterium]|nr:MMPL family transporter [Candidatus Limnocylindrales bacterium]
MFSRWGAFIYRRRRLVFVLAIVVAAGAATLAKDASSHLTTSGWLDPTSESSQVSARLEASFGGGRTSYVALFRSTDPNGDATSPAFQGAIATTLASTLGQPHVTGVTGFAETHDTRFISTDGHAAYVLINLDMSEDQSVDAVDSIQASLAPPAGYSVALTGFGPVQKDAARISEQDLQRAETVSLPIAALVLVLVFGSLIAGAMPLLVAGVAIPTALGIVDLVAQQTQMSIYVLNIATMLGLALAIDYSLFITSRFREELARGRTVEQAVERAIGTAGKAVLFSGIAVAIGLSGLLWFRASALSSIGLGGSIVVLASVLYSLTFLPAALGMLGPRVNALSVDGLLRRLGLRRGDPAQRRSRWEAVAHGVMRRPIAVLVPVLLVLFVLGSPFFSLAQGVPDATVYPAGVASRDAWVALQTEFPQGETTPIVALVDPTDGNPTSPGTIAAVMAYSDRVAALANIDRIEGPFTITDPTTGQPMTSDQVAQAYDAPAGTLPPALAQAISALRDTYIKGSTIQLDAVSPLKSTEPAGTSQIEQIRRVDHGSGIAQVQIGGAAAIGEDFLLSQSDRMPWAIGTTLLASAIILFLLFGSLAIPIKAVAMTLLSLTASFGALVWIFQDGNLSNVLHFTPLGYTIAGNPVIMFATLIGLSMDYEVLLLSRIQEAYRRTGDNQAAVAEGLSKTAGVITGAAMIMVTVFAAFALADTITIKSIGVGMAIAVALDATIVRVLLVPATMRLLGAWNWWAPGILGRLAERLGFSHVEDDADLVTSESDATRAAGMPA